MEPEAKWFTQSRQYARPRISSWQGAVAACAVLAALIGLAMLVLSLEPLAPLNYWLLGLWLALALALIVGFHAFARPRTDRPWKQQAPDGAGARGERR
jgi:hypothetical protein